MLPRSEIPSPRALSPAHERPTSPQLLPWLWAPLEAWDCEWAEAPESPKCLSI